MAKPPKKPAKIKVKTLPPKKDPKGGGWIDKGRA
jgi:hypothetical protein